VTRRMCDKLTVRRVDRVTSSLVAPCRRMSQTLVKEFAVEDGGGDFRSVFGTNIETFQNDA